MYMYIIFSCRRSRPPSSSAYKCIEQHDIYVVKKYIRNMTTERTPSSPPLLFRRWRKCSNNTLVAHVLGVKLSNRVCVFPPYGLKYSLLLECSIWIDKITLLKHRDLLDRQNSRPPIKTFFFLIKKYTVP